MAAGPSFVTDTGDKLFCMDVLAEKAGASESFAEEDNSRVQLEEHRG